LRSSLNDVPFASFPSARISMQVFPPSAETEILAAPVARQYPRIRRVVATSTFPSRE
jgi:hypothetical protein